MLKEIVLVLWVCTGSPGEDGAKNITAADCESQSLRTAGPAVFNQQTTQKVCAALFAEAGKRWGVNGERFAKGETARPLSCFAVDYTSEPSQ